MRRCRFPDRLSLVSLSVLPPWASRRFLSLSHYSFGRFSSGRCRYRVDRVGRPFVHEQRLLSCLWSASWRARRLVGSTIILWPTIVSFYRRTAESICGSATTPRRQGIRDSLGCTPLSHKCCLIRSESPRPRLAEL